MIDCFNRGFREDEVDDEEDGVGERLVLLLFVDEVNAVSSERIELADESEFVFFSLNPVANDAHPLVFFVLLPFVNEELEFDIDGLLLVGLSDVVDSED